MNNSKNIFTVCCIATKKTFLNLSIDKSGNGQLFYLNAMQ